MALFDRDREFIDGPIGGVQLGNRAVQAGLTIRNPALIFCLGSGNFLISGRHRHGVDHHGRRADAHPEGTGGDRSRCGDLFSGCQDEGAHFSA